MMKLRRFLWTVSLLVVCAVSHARQDSIRFSLLTCSPGQEIYALFGHTAIRYQNFTQGADWVFNYGVFSFDTPNFVLRFVRGETDYQLGVLPFDAFEAEYAWRGSSVRQQTLNLTAAEKLRLFALLEENYRPANRVYRYNYFYDNCTTRARDQIERCIDGRVVYPDSLSGMTFRRIVHEFTAGSPWDEWGMDVCLGAEADRPIGPRSQQFSPFYMMRYASLAVIEAEDGSRRPLVTDEAWAVEADGGPEASPAPLTPLAASCLLLALSLLAGGWQLRTRRVWWGWEASLMALQGLAGCVIAFLFFFSVHPTVGSNWMLFLFNPVPLCYAPVLVWRLKKRKKDLYPLLNVLYLTLFMVIVLFRVQEFNLSVLPLASALLVTSASHVLVLKRNK